MLSTSVDRTAAHSPRLRAQRRTSFPAAATAGWSVMEPRTFSTAVAVRSHFERFSVSRGMLRRVCRCSDESGKLSMRARNVVLP